MNPTLGLLLPLVLAQSPMPPVVAPPAGPGCATCGVSGGRFSPGGPMQYRQVCPPLGPPAPVLAVRAVLPDGAAVSVPTGAADDPSAPSGAVFGFRPGFVYRLRVDHLPRHNGSSLFATLEVRGSIVPRPGMRYMEYAAPLLVTQADADRVLTGGTVTKVIYLENPERALPFESAADKPIEVSAADYDAAVSDAELSGRIVAVLRIGDRDPGREEHAATYVPGTVLLPGETKLGLPTVPPPLACSAIPLYDPILGPKPSTEECILNGGDGGPRVGVGPGGKLGGLDPTDAAAEYTVGNKRRVVPSNVVCVCAPRFVLRRVDVTVSGFTRAVSPNANRQVVGRDVFAQREFAQQVLAREKTLTAVGRERPGQEITVVGLQASVAQSRPSAIAMTEGVKQVAMVVEPDEITAFPARLVLTKSVDPPGPAKSGDTLAVTLKFFNNTRQPVTDLVLSDNLSGRFEYVDGSAAANVVSNVTKQENDAGSVLLRFDIPGPIPPAGSGLVVFKVKVR